ncbi:MAG: hypothetical protein GY827_00790 [Cytophagales bacterium]|nr:hypothetical protein [Cytophagales bacterium]
MLTILGIIVALAIVFVVNFLIVKKIEEQPDNRFQNSVLIKNPEEVALLFHDIKHAVKVCLLILETERYIVFNTRRTKFKKTKKTFEIKKSPLIHLVYQKAFRFHGEQISVEEVIERIEKFQGFEENFYHKLQENGIKKPLRHFDMLFFTRFVSILLISIICLIIPTINNVNGLYFLLSIILGGAAIFLIFTQLKIAELTEEGEEYIRMKKRSISKSFPDDPNVYAQSMHIAKVGEKGFIELRKKYYLT